jgi:hypothetical protein
MGNGCPMIDAASPVRAISGLSVNRWRILENAIFFRHADKGKL